MPPKQLAPKLLSWASELDDQTRAQAERTSRLSIIEGHVALMPDAHLGIGATVGSVIPTRDAIIPAAVGVDIGCGMVAVETDLTAEDLPDDLDPLMPRLERAIPAGVGRGHDRRTEAGERWLAAHGHPFDDRQEKKTIEQFGTLGSGNHFACVALAPGGQVWSVVHSGSRGIGNQLATRHIRRAREVAHDAGLHLEDRDLAYFKEGTLEFDEYIADMLWAQEYARANREQMMDVLLHELFGFVGRGGEIRRINCHHNYSARERHAGQDLWITRKGAIRARQEDVGVIPGSMGNDVLIVRGKGEASSYHSCAHGAGRRHSRTQAKKRFQVDELRELMRGKAWNRDRAGALLDEIPGAYKDLDQVMADQADLVEIEQTMREILNFKGS
jgi:tRNA-splicing ligase RtcB